MEEEIFRPWIHKHPMSRMGVESCDSKYNWCWGCWRYFIGGEAVYGCRRDDCGFEEAFHQECLEMPREIRHHHVHPSHKLTMSHYSDGIIGGNCAVCDDDETFGMVYGCSEGCDQVWIHMICAGLGGLQLDASADDEGTMKHPSHPQHLLRFSNKTRLYSFPCDACGNDNKGNSYMCTVCDYSLSLAYHLPIEYIKYEFECAICKEALRLRRWVYHCQLCRYVVHIKCATITVAPSNYEIENGMAIDDHKDIIKGPIDDIYEEIIRPFIKRERRDFFIPHDENNTIDGKFDFCKHHHPLTFTAFPLSSPSHDHNEEEEDDDDDDVENITISKVTCDGCTLPIQENKEEDYNGYMSCDECKYFLHLACFNLPLDLPSNPLHPLKGHNLTLQNACKLTDWINCNICEGYTNGLYYACSQCDFNIDTKCVSLPSAIKHAAHPHHHHLNLLTDNNRSWSGFCGVCYYTITYEKGFYRCDGCRFSMCDGCVLLPARNKHRFDNHWLPLTYDAYVHHPGDFYCSSCELKMYPKRGMYHCRDCDQSFHPKCFPATSGGYRNIKYGKYVHGYPLRFQIITKKMRCDFGCGRSYDEPGFQCDSCNFAMCRRHVNDSELRPSN